MANLGLVDEALISGLDSEIQVTFTRLMLVRFGNGEDLEKATDCCSLSQEEEIVCL